ncbi:universal stress protein [Paracoccus sp. EF6]|uniref:Universal stress protein n=2 Tax=Paracoccus benzoatiresistens TaxID=2997341 RepID=A0ABT4J8J8_9RHOB|nr:universal stress protein [Paracoccus sp. EF6]
MRCILVATDLSVRSDRAVQRALRLSAMLKLPCRIVSVIDSDLPDDMQTFLKNDVEQRLSRFAQSLTAPGQEVSCKVLSGDPHEAIVDQAETDDAGLVVLGLHRPRPFRDMVQGTTMVRIVRASPRPVLLVNDTADHDYTRVLLPVSFSPACAAAMRIAGMVAPGARIQSFHAVPIPFPGFIGEGPDGATARDLCRQAEKERDTWVATLDPEIAVPEIEIVSAGRIETMSRMAAEKPDLIAVGAHTRVGFSPNVLGSFVTDLIKNPPCDVLVARA